MNFSFQDLSLNDSLHPTISTPRDIVITSGFVNYPNDVYSYVVKSAFDPNGNLSNTGFFENTGVIRQSALSFDGTGNNRIFILNPFSNIFNTGRTMVQLRTTDSPNVSDLPLVGNFFSESYLNLRILPYPLLVNPTRWYMTDRLSGNSPNPVEASDVGYWQDLELAGNLYSTDTSLNPRFHLNRANFLPMISFTGDTFGTKMTGIDTGPINEFTIFAIIRSDYVGPVSNSNASILGKNSPGATSSDFYLYSVNGATGLGIQWEGGGGAVNTNDFDFMKKDKLVGITQYYSGYTGKLLTEFFSYPPLTPTNAFDEAFPDVVQGTPSEGSAPFSFDRLGAGIYIWSGNIGEVLIFSSGLISGHMRYLIDNYFGPKWFGLYNF